MKYFVDGDQLVITRDDFIDLQESPALFYPVGSDIAQTVLKAESIGALSVGVLMRMQRLLNLEPQKYKRPTCPLCKAIMVRTYYQTEDRGWFVCWLCECDPGLKAGDKPEEE